MNEPTPTPSQDERIAQALDALNARPPCPAWCVRHRGSTVTSHVGEAFKIGHVTVNLTRIDYPRSRPENYVQIDGAYLHPWDARGIAGTFHQVGTHDLAEVIDGMADVLLGELS